MATPLCSSALCKREAVDHGGEHAHVIGRGAIHPAMAGGEAAPDVAAADDDRDLHAEVVHLLHLPRDLLHDLRRDVVAPARFAERFAAQFEDDAFVGGRGTFHLGGDDRSEMQTWGGKTAQKLGGAHPAFSFELHFVAGGDAPRPVATRTSASLGERSDPGSLPRLRDDRGAEDFQLSRLCPPRRRAR